MLLIGTAITIAETAKLSGDKISAVRVGKVVKRTHSLLLVKIQNAEIKHSAYNRKTIAASMLSNCKNIFT